jgi:hypothetical protein
MNQRIEQIVAGEVQVGIAYIPTGIETQTSEYVQEKTEELMSDSHKALSAALGQQPHPRGDGAVDLLLRNGS